MLRTTTSFRWAIGVLSLAIALNLPLASAESAQDLPNKDVDAQTYVVDRMEAPLLEDVDREIAELRAQGRLRHARISKRTGRARVLYGDLGRLGSAPTVAAKAGPLQNLPVSRDGLFEFLRDHHTAIGSPAPEAELAVTREVAEPSATHLYMEQRIGDYPVFDADASVHVDKQNRVFAVTSTFVPGLDPTLGYLEPSIDGETARAVALDRLGVAPEGLRSQDPFTAEIGVYPENTGILAWRLIVPTANPFGQWEVFVDAATGAVIGEPRSMVLSVGQARVFVPNPVVSTGQTGLRDNGDQTSAIPESAYQTVELLGLDAGGFLTGAFVSTDRTSNRVNRADQDFTDLRRGDRGFEEVQVYWAIDMAQRYIQNTLGIQNAANYRLRVDCHAFSADNSNYTASGGGIGVLNFGDGGVDDAEDAEIIWHEYGHAILDNQRQLQFGGEAGALHEGWGDYVAATLSTTVAADSRFHAFVGEWDAVSYNPGNPPFLRRVDTSKRYPQNVVGQVHTDGEIWSSILWDIHQALGRKNADTIIFNANFLLPRDAGFLDAAAALIESDRQINGGANGAAIRDVLADHGIQLSSGEPAITNVKFKRGKPKLKVIGSEFDTFEAIIEIDGVAVGNLKYPVKFRQNNGTSTVVASKASNLGALLPRGVQVSITVLNPATGVRSAPFVFVP